ncbi:ABC transporter permease subunit [Psychromonas antarctica]|uniref:ABC transporter permease subunit n=1 Tax=Psychromonas antarctica TaxID=67573 RepID=UPI001EE7A377|nr:ABC transporter permease subunit [Psychromonas antarctica]MCG6201254.1 ABC transporter permease subunit [Psychromonas antarctica]
MLINYEFNEDKIQSPLQYTWSIFKRNNIAIAAMWVAIILVMIVIFAGYILPNTPTTQVKQLLLPPYWIDGGVSDHFLGTDDLGRDTLTRLIQGIQLTLGGALLLTLIVSILGTIIGATAALTKGLKASILHHFLDALLIIPTLLSALILIAIFGPSYENCLIAVSLSLLPQFIRAIYINIENELNKQYIIALRLDGAANIRLLRFGIFPNILESMVSLLNRIFSLAILEISTLGFLGFGTQFWDVELGALIASSIGLIFSSPWLVLFPGIAIFIIVLVFNVFTEGLRHAVIEGEDE